MSWSVRFHPAIKKDLRRLPSEARIFILETVMPILVRNPHQGEPLHGPLKGFLKYRTGEYRISYSISSQRREILVIEIGPRGGFYEHLKRRLKK